MENRDELQQSFDPRTWMQSPEDGGANAGASSRRGRRADRPVRPPFFLAGATAIGILSAGAGAAYLSRADTAAATQVAAALESSELEGSAAGASVAGEQP